MANELPRCAIDMLAARLAIIPESILYDGGGGAGTPTGELQVEADSAAVKDGGADVIDVGMANAIDIFLVNAAASDSCTLLVTEFSGSTPTVTNQIRQTPVEVGVTDQVVTVDLLMIGGTTATGYAKTPVRTSVTPNHYVMISLAAQSAGAVFYARYQLVGVT